MIQLVPRSKHFSPSVIKFNQFNVVWGKLSVLSENRNKHITVGRM